MTQRKNSARKNLNQSRQPSQSKKRLASTLPAQGLCWLGSFSILSSGLAFAQTDRAVDNLVPTVSSSNASNTTLIANKLKKDVVIQVSSAPKVPATVQPEVSKSGATLRQRLKQSRTKSRTRRRLANTVKVKKKASPSVGARKPQTKKKVTTSSAGTRTLRRKLQNRPASPVIIRQRKPTAKKAPSKSAVTKKRLQVKPKATTPSPSVVKKAAPAPQRAKQSPQRNTAAASKTRDYNNAYIDPTNYQKKLNRVKYKAPSSVVIKNRSGCKSVLNRGQGISANCQKTATRSKKQGTANTPRKPTPSWIRKSQNTSLAKVSTPTAKKSSPVANSRRNQIASNSRKINLRRRDRTNSSIAKTVGKRRYSRKLQSIPSNIASAVKSQLRPNRFIPSPENFASVTTTRVNSTTVAPKGGVLSAPITAAKIAPRPSVADYNIPLASVLPQILFNPVYAHNSTGLNFPLSVPGRISSLFGWRQHPITGNRRFHSGIDIAASMGTPIVAAYDGQVEIADWVGGYGLTVTVNHGKSQQTLYGHMSEVLVRPGQIVQKGTVLGKVGSTGNSTGPHLHFEVRQLTSSGWVAVNPSAELQISLNELIQSNQSAQVYKPEN